jgi:hypothetical protein
MNLDDFEAALRQSMLSHVVPGNEIHEIMRMIPSEYPEDMIATKTLTCPGCGGTTIVICSKAVAAEWETLKRPALPVDLFPQANRDQRETLMSGFHSVCWDKMFETTEEELVEEWGD